MLRQTLQTAGRAVSRELSGRYRIIYLIAVVEALFCFIFPGLVNDDYDTWTYFDTWKFYFLSRPETFIDSYRTPVYPLFMSLTSLDGLLPLTSIAFAQWIVFILVIPWFRRLAHMLVRSESITFWMTLFYVAYWGVIDVNYWIRTESLSQSFLILFVYHTIRAMRKPKKKSLVWSAFWLLILVFLRPAFLYLPPIYIAVCLYIMARNRRKGLMGLLGASVVCGIIYGYAAAFEHRHGFFAISDVSDYNNYYRLVQYDIIDASCFPSYLLPAMTNTDSVPGDTIWTYNIPSWIHHTTDFHEGVNANISKHKDEQVCLCNFMDLPEFLEMPRQPVPISLLARRHDADTRHGYSRHLSHDISGGGNPVHDTLPPGHARPVAHRRHMDSPGHSRMGGSLLEL